MKAKEWFIRYRKRESLDEEIIPISGANPFSDADERERIREHAENRLAGFLNRPPDHSKRKEPLASVISSSELSPPPSDAMHLTE
jgi:hypothetical protein